MKPFQQRRLFQTATSEQTSRITDHVAAVTLQENRFHPSKWIAATLTALLISCASLTPDRIQVLAAIAGQAAQIGAQQWLAKHPEHRAAFDAVIQAITALVKSGNINQADYVALLSSLPVTTLSGPSGEVYLTEDRLVIWDGELRKAVTVKGAAEQPVMKAVRDGLRKAVVQMPPALPGPRTKPMPTWGFQNAKLEPEGTVTNTTIHFPGSIGLFTTQPTNRLTIEAPPTLTVTPLNITNDAAPLKLLGRTNVTRSVLDVQTHAGSVPVVTVRWRLAPGGIYHVQHQALIATNWFTFGTVTNSGGMGSTNWSVPWPPGVQVGLWRVLRVR